MSEEKKNKTEDKPDEDKPSMLARFDPGADPALQYAMFLRPLLDEMGIGITEQALADAIRPICGGSFDAKALAIISAVTGRIIDDRKANIRRRAQAEDRMARRAAHERSVELAILRMVGLLERIDTNLAK